MLAATPVISEFLASNSDGLRDIDGDSSDWIEIFNPTDTTVDLAGWSLTDDVNDIHHWVFPSVTIDPGDFLIVFASGKDRDVAGEELHTNFQLTTNGEFLGLFQPNGEVASLYSPLYPPQATNLSYGMNFRTEEFVRAGDQATYFVPFDNSVADQWQTPAFDDTGWDSGATGLGYGVVQPGFDVTYYKAKSSGDFDGIVNSLAIAREVTYTPAYQSVVVEADAPVINHLGSGGGGHYGNNQAFPTQSIGVDINHFVFQARTSIEIPSPGDYSFGVNSDDGFSLRISGDGEDFTSEFPNPRGASDTIANFTFTQAGRYDVELLMFEAGGSSSVEFFAAPGTHAKFDAGVFDLVGDVESGGLFAAVPYVPGGKGLVETDIASSLQEISSSVYVRIPFNVTDPSTLDNVRLSMRYDDGFVAAINGVEVARRNAPATIAYDSQATVSRDPTEVHDVEAIVLPSVAVSSLVEGMNVLTIQGLNLSPSDESLLVLPELSASGLLEDQIRFFTTPTPGQPNRNPVAGIVDRVFADAPAGFYSSPFDVTLTTSSSDAVIRYTIDGSEPSTTNGLDYTGSIPITGTTNLRAVAVKPDHASLPSRTWTYLFLDDVLTQSNDGVAPAGWPTTWKKNVVDYGIDPEVLAIEGAQAVKDALLAIPSWSITTDLDNLFDPEIGIYANATGDGDEWERPASVELIQPDGSGGFQVNAGLRIRGGFSRSNNNPKHAFRLFFRGVYGDAELNYPVHGSEGTDTFKKLDLRTAQNYSWSFQGNPSNNFVADVLARYNQRDLGQPYTRSSWLHLYVNGQYWGLYQTQERAEAEFAETYFGGNANDYDVLKPERGTYANIATDGEFTAYDRLFEKALARAPDGITPALVDFSLYMEAQGLNPDGTRNPAYEVLLDVDNLIAYMITILQGGNLDAPISNFLNNNRINNHFSVRDRTGDEGFRFFIHDSEHTLLDINANRNGPYNHANFESSVNYFNPQWLHQQLMANVEYRLRFADKVQEAFFHGGPLTAEAQIAKLNIEAAKLDLAIIAESARWGDAKRAQPLLKSDWLNAIARVRDDFFPNRNAVLIDQFRSTQLLLKDIDGNYKIAVPAPLFPSIDAPEFQINDQSQSGGQVPPHSLLRMSAAVGTIYYTTDGSDPRLPGGAISPNASAFDQTILLNNSLAVRARAFDTATGTWSALHAAGFIVPQEAASIANLRVTEVHYNPAGSDDTEFMELANISSGDDAVILDLGGITLTDGPSSPLVLPATATLGPGQHGVIVRDRIAFLAAYPAFDPVLILGEYSGALGNAGERIRLVDANGVELFDFDYGDNDPWPEWADGIGGSLVLRDPAATPADQLGKPYHWRGSTFAGGSPGAADPEPLGVVINEVLAHTDDPELDTIELYNATSAAVDISGWYLSDSSADLFKFAIPPGTTIPAGGFLIFDEHDFNPTPLTPGPKDFALSGSHGDSIWLVEANASGDAVVAFSDHVDIGATFNGVTLGRKPGGTGRLVPLGQPSLGAANGEHATADVVITEVQYHPSAPSAAALAIDPTISESDLEFLEVHNHSAAAVDLTNWRIRGSSDYDFAGGQTIGVGELLVVVPFDPAQAPNLNLVNAFRAHYGIDASVVLVGPFSPSLGNSFGLVKLQQPDEAPVDEPTVLPRVLVDEVFYDDLIPWPAAADGTGMSLQRTRAIALGNDAASWRAAVPTPGTTRFVPQVESVTINDNETTRSEVTSISIVFDAKIQSPSAAAFSLTNTTSGELVTGIAVSSTNVSGKTVSILTFTTGPSVIQRAIGQNTLANGAYELSILASGIAAEAGSVPMDEDATFGDQATDDFFRKYGDHDGNGSVGLLDFAAFRRTFGLASGDTDYAGDLDSDGDGVISLLDFAAFRRAFGS